MARRPVFLTVRLGRWFEASAAGWAVIAIPVLVLMLLAAAALGGQALAG